MSLSRLRLCASVFIFLTFLLHPCKSFIAAKAVPSAPSLRGSAKNSSAKKSGGDGLSMGSDSGSGAASILLVRHGQTEWNVAGRYQGRQDSPLTDDGMRQAVALGQRLRKRRSKVDYICSSDLPRAKLTADTIAKIVGLQDVQVFEALRERGFGIFEGCTRGEVETKFPNEFAESRKFNLHYKVPGGESRQEVLDRCLPVLDEIADARITFAQKDALRMLFDDVARIHHLEWFGRGQGGTAVVVTHGGVVSLVLRELLGIPWGGAPAKGELRILNTSICDLQRQADGRWHIQSIGDTAHTEVPTAPAPSDTVEETQEEVLSVPEQ